MDELGYEREGWKEERGEEGEWCEGCEVWDEGSAAMAAASEPGGGGAGYWCGGDRVTLVEVEVEVGEVAWWDVCRVEFGAVDVEVVHAAISSSSAVEVVSGGRGIQGVYSFGGETRSGPCIDKDGRASEPLDPFMSETRSALRAALSERGKSSSWSIWGQLGVAYRCNALHTPPQSISSAGRPGQLVDRPARRLCSSSTIHLVGPDQLLDRPAPQPSSSSTPPISSTA